MRQSVYLIAFILCLGLHAKAETKIRTSLVTAAALSEKSVDAIQMGQQRNAILRASFDKIKALLPACAYPAGASARIAQLKALKLSEIKPLGFATYTRDKANSGETTTPQVLHADFFFVIPAGNGYPALTMGTSFQSRILQRVDGKDFDGENYLDLTLFAVSETADGAFILPQLQSVSSELDCNVPSELLRNLKRF